MVLRGELTLMRQQMDHLSQETYVCILLPGYAREETCMCAFQVCMCV